MNFVSSLIAVWDVSNVFVDNFPLNPFMHDDLLDERSAVFSLSVDETRGKVNWTYEYDKHSNE